VSHIPRTKFNSVAIYYSWLTAHGTVFLRQKNQEILHFLFILKIHYSIHNSPHTLLIIACELNAKQQLTRAVITHFSENLCCHDSRQSECDYQRCTTNTIQCPTHLPLNLWHGWDVQGIVQYYCGYVYEIKENIHFNRAFRRLCDVVHSLGRHVTYYRHLTPPKYSVDNNAGNVGYGRIRHTEVTKEVMFELQNVARMYNSSQSTPTLCKNYTKNSAENKLLFPGLEMFVPRMPNEIYHVTHTVNGTNLQMLQYATLLRTSIVTKEI